jgi:hypothetical protein
MWRKRPTQDVDARFAKTDPFSRVPVNYAVRFSGPVTALRAKTRAKSKIDCPEVAQLPSPATDQ